MRNYIVASWNDADQYDYSGEMLGGSRHAGRSQKVHFNADGSACVASYSDPEPVKAKKPALKDRIIPQYKRVQTLTDQLIELENAYRSGEYDIDEYSLMRGVVCKKRDRAVELYKRAVKPAAKTEDEYEQAQPYTSPSKAPQYTRFPEQIATFGSNKAVHSAKGDLFYYTSAVVGLFTAFMFFTH